MDTAQNFKVYAAATTLVAPGDRDQLRLTSNFRSNGDRFINNELVKVLSLDEQKMVVSRGNGKEANRRDLVHVDQGVTVTSYSSQSKGSDQMLCSAPVRSFGAVDRKQFYVTMSRARRSMHLYTDSSGNVYLTKGRGDAFVARANAQRCVYRLVRGGRIFLRDICFAIFYPRGHE